MNFDSWIIGQFFLIFVSVVATLFIIIKIALLLMPLSKDVEMVRGISDLYISLGFALVSILGFFSVNYFNNNFLLVIVISICSILSFYFAFVALGSLKRSLSIPLKMIKNMNNISKNRRKN